MRDLLTAAYVAASSRLSTKRKRLLSVFNWTLEVSLPMTRNCKEFLNSSERMKHFRHLSFCKWGGGAFDKHLFRTARAPRPQRIVAAKPGSAPHSVYACQGGFPWALAIRTCEDSGH